MTGDFDLIIIGAGPAGTACALAAVKRGCRVAIIDRAKFPRHKVCGDCLNPSVWPVLTSLGVGDEIRALPGVALNRVRFVSRQGKVMELPLPPEAEHAVTREAFDAVLLAAAVREGAVLFDGSPVKTVARTSEGWKVETGGISLTSRLLVAADGRNSTTCRLLGIAPPAKARRMAVQCHIPFAEKYRQTVALEWNALGYCGLAHVEADRLNLCVVSSGQNLAAAKEDARHRYDVPPDQIWHSIAPIDRKPIPPAPMEGLFLAGDAARVVEPFTGEGIYYALRSGELAGEAAARFLEGEESAGFYTSAHTGLYRNRLWVNRLARFAVLRPWAGDAVLAIAGIAPEVLGWLTKKVVSAPVPPSGKSA